jgi:hypothetical protein
LPRFAAADEVNLLDRPRVRRRESIEGISVEVQVLSGTPLKSITWPNVAFVT